MSGSRFVSGLPGRDNEFAPQRDAVHTIDAAIAAKQRRRKGRADTNSPAPPRDRFERYYANRPTPEEFRQATNKLLGEKDD